jgi:hypothetical protein
MARYPDMIQAPVFCTDSIFCEYSHLDFIRSFGAKLIEMETSSFYLMADLVIEAPIIDIAPEDDKNIANRLYELIS